MNGNMDMMDHLLVLFKMYNFAKTARGALVAPMARWDPSWAREGETEGLE
jgi:hypothetical protein